MLLLIMKHLIQTLCSLCSYNYRLVVSDTKIELDVNWLNWRRIVEAKYMVIYQGMALS